MVRISDEKTNSRDLNLLLTSSGLSKRVIGEALQEMVGKKPSDCKVGFIPTAANVEPYPKDWMIAQFAQLARYGFYSIDVVDISADGVDWRARLKDVDVLWLTGGNTFHLLNQVRKTGFDEWLKAHGEGKVYVGASASTIIMTPTIAIADGYDENFCGIKDWNGLGYVDFEIEPHCDMERFETIKSYVSQSPHSMYALDDLSAIKIVNGKTEVLSGGTWKYYQ
jgi:dipeptidase E